ncbi:MAG: 1-acyl-sn-glycerol-3-phosphate acyltransferase [Anaerolineaceae bacterium]|nr:1-acyl-sn-glycerol-3-phosphate acyltransferase [Anaerolineaceae bacterium]MCB9098924.1 1-acyl-sn-glycerol-3-phosphate acyltransferase [Anaerolineales bacterium]
MATLLRIFFFVCIVRPLIMIIIGLNVFDKRRLPLTGPAIIAPNHNSHLDTLTLLSLWPISKINRVHPVAAADYFLSNPVMAWFSLNVIGIIPIERQKKDPSDDPLATSSEALERGDILIIFPEGSRGLPEIMNSFKSGISRLAERHPAVPIVPVFMHGLGKSLPKGDFVLVPFFCDVFIGEPIYWQGSVEATMAAYKNSMESLAIKCDAPVWE